MHPKVKPRIAVVAAAVLAIIAVGAMYLHFTDARSACRGCGGGGGGIPVVVAAQDIPAGTLISEEMVKVVEVPEHEVVAGAIKGDSQAVLGKITRVPLTKGEQIIREGGPGRID